MAAEQYADVLLEYQRDGMQSTGNLLVLAGGKPQQVEGFEKIEYRDLLLRLARVIAKTPLARVVITRTDAPNLFPYVLDQQTVDLFRKDPVAAIQAMTYELPEARVEKTAGRTVEVAPIRAGYHTLAAAFGEAIYVRTRGNSIECPGCGLWGEVSVGRTGRGVFTCHRRCADFRVPISLSRLWAAIAVEALLDNEHIPRFFLPRPWNDGRSWISREELKNKYTAYVAEKEQACTLQGTV